MPQRLSYAQQRERDKLLRRGAKKVEEAEKQVAEREADIKAIEARIAAGELKWDDGTDIFALHQKKTRDMETAMSLWELASQELEELQQKLGTAK